MSEQNTNQSETQNDQLAMMEKIAPVKKVEFGAEVKGSVVTVTEENILVNIGGSSEAIWSKADATDSDGNCSVKEGDKVTLFVIEVKEDEISVAKTLKNGKANKTLIRKMLEKKTPVEGRVTGMNKGGYNVTFLQNRAFCPFSAIDIIYPTDTAAYMGQTLEFVISRVENKGNNIVLTRLPLLEGDMEEQLVELEKAVTEETPITGTVTRTTNFGAFVAIGGGVEGLVHISELTWDRDEKVQEIVKEGDSISVKVLSVERKKELRDSRISLSLKRLGNDPWIDAIAKINEGDSLDGEVARIVGFGAFVKIFPGVEALVRTEELAWGRIRKPSDVVSKGDKVNVTIIKIDHDSHKIDCSLKDASQDPWAGVEEKFAVGTVVTGKVSGQKEYGFFVDLNDDITGLLPMRRIGKDMNGQIKNGEEVKVTIESVDTDSRRISLAAGDVPEATESKSDDKKGADRATAAKYMKNQAPKTEEGDSDFAFMLKNALKK